MLIFRIIVFIIVTIAKPTMSSSFSCYHVQSAAKHSLTAVSKCAKACKSNVKLGGMNTAYHIQQTDLAS